MDRHLIIKQLSPSCCGSLGLTRCGMTFNLQHPGVMIQAKTQSSANSIKTFTRAVMSSKMQLEGNSDNLQGVHDKPACLLINQPHMSPVHHQAWHRLCWTHCLPCDWLPTTCPVPVPYRGINCIDILISSEEFPGELWMGIRKHFNQLTEDVKLLRICKFKVTEDLFTLMIFFQEAVSFKSYLINKMA